jgi:hypothetical protein
MMGTGNKQLVGGRPGSGRPRSGEPPFLEANTTAGCAILVEQGSSARYIPCTTRIRDESLLYDVDVNFSYCLCMLAKPLSFGVFVRVLDKRPFNIRREIYPGLILYMLSYP